MILKKNPGENQQPRVNEILFLSPQQALEGIVIKFSLLVDFANFKEKEFDPSECQLYFMLRTVQNFT